MPSTVVATAMVSHLWANQSQEFARTANPSEPKSGRFGSWQGGASFWYGKPRTWFRGPVLYSYNEPIARLVPAVDGSTYALVTAGRPKGGDRFDPANYEKWSVATSNHMPGHATRGHVAGTFTVPSIAGRADSYESHREFGDAGEFPAVDHGLNLEFMRQTFRNAVRRFGHVAQVPEWSRTDYSGDERRVMPVAEHVEAALVAAWENAEDYARLFAVPVPNPWSVATEWPATADAVRDIAAPLAARLERLEAARNTPENIAKREAAQRKAKETRERRERLRWQGTPAERVAEWRAGAPVDVLRHNERLDADGGALLRVRGKRLETSQGADVPLADAVRVFRFVKLCRERGEGWRRNGVRVPVGAFQVDVIEPNGDFHAGCHRINWPEIVSAATAAGVLDMEPAADAVTGKAHG